MEPTASWTLDELTRRVGGALSVDYDGQASGRVRDVPDQRVIRWYTTLGLVDRPAAMRGRTALYGPRHLRQLVAIKRLQARGLSLADVQVELAGASEADLEQIARVPLAEQIAQVPLAPASTAPEPGGPELARPDAGPPVPEAPDAGPPVPEAPDAGPPVPEAPAAGRPASEAPGATVPTSTVDGQATTGAPPAQTGGAGRRFWAAGPAAPPPAAPARGALGRGSWRRPSRPPVRPAAHLQGIRLGDEATLLIGVQRPVDAADVRALRAAARPLLEALHARGLAGPGHEPGPGGPDNERELP
ncbi:MAG TPA: MerR family transcriptional regulator [Actinomycetes bacterium]|jgi:hypothetical protein|nr:MerR family transcriptional regulator [Actinomycetes bacterium]